MGSCNSKTLRRRQQVPRMIGECRVCCWACLGYIASSKISPVLASPKKKADPEVITYQAAFLKDARQVANLQALHNPSLSSPKRFCFRPWAPILPGMWLCLIAWVIFLWSWPVRPGPCDTHSAPGTNVRRNVCRIPGLWQHPNLYKWRPKSLWRGSVGMQKMV